MKLRYKIIMFLMLLIFCVGNVSAINPDNNTTDINTIGFDNIETNNSDVENSSCWIHQRNQIDVI